MRRRPPSGGLLPFVMGRRTDTLLFHGASPHDDDPFPGPARAGGGQPRAGGLRRAALCRRAARQPARGSAVAGGGDRRRGHAAPAGQARDALPPGAAAGPALPACAGRALGQPVADAAAGAAHLSPPAALFLVGRRPRRARHGGAGRQRRCGRPGGAGLRRRSVEAECTQPHALRPGAHPDRRDAALRHADVCVGCAGAGRQRHRQQPQRPHPQDRRGVRSRPAQRLAPLRA